MTRIFSSGWECGGLYEYDATTVFRGTIANVGTTVKTGNRSVECATTSNAIVSQAFGRINFATIDDIYTSFWFYRTHAGPAWIGSANNHLFAALRNAGYLHYSHNTNHLWWSSQWPLNYLVDTGFHLLEDTWYHIQWRVFSNFANSVVQIRVDDNVVCDWAGALPGGVWYLEHMVYIGLTQAVGFRLIHYFDDAIINDELGAIDNTWPGIMQFDEGIPDGAGALQQWSLFPNTGEAAWQDVDEVPDDIDATYLYETVNGQRFLVNFTDWDSAGKAPYKVHVKALARKVGGGDTDQIKILARSGANDSLSGALGQTTSYDLYPFQMDTDPGGGAWTDTLIDALQIGCEEVV